MVKEKPIIFSTDMVRAILEDRKWQIRRVIKFPENGSIPHRYHGQTKSGEHEFMFGCIHRGPNRDGTIDFVFGTTPNFYAADWSESIKAPYQPGDILLVRETWALQECEKCMAGIPALGGECRCDYVYRTNYGKTEDDTFPPSMYRWKPSIHMPREAARIFLKVTDVWPERVQDISEEDAKAEGVTAINDSGCGYRGAFRELWNALNAKRGFGWDANPWVWVYSFERVDKPNGWPGEEVEG